MNNFLQKIRDMFLEAYDSLIKGIKNITEREVALEVLMQEMTEYLYSEGYTNEEIQKFKDDGLFNPTTAREFKRNSDIFQMELDKWENKKAFEEDVEDIQSLPTVETYEHAIRKVMRDYMDKLDSDEMQSIVVEKYNRNYELIPRKKHKRRKKCKKKQCALIDKSQCTYYDKDPVRECYNGYITGPVRIAFIIKLNEIKNELETT